jgi:hypothetical protein
MIEMNGLARNMWGVNVFIMQIDYMKISCKEDVPICPTNFAKKMERNLHKTTSWWKTYGKRLFSEDLEVRDVCPKNKILVNLGQLEQRERFFF